MPSGAGTAGERRYAHFIKRVADWEELWSLSSEDGWVLACDPDGTEVIPVWPHPIYAQACATGDWADNTPAPIPLDDWLQTWTPGILRDKRHVAVFPTPEVKGVVVTADRLREDLEDELTWYE